MSEITKEIISILCYIVLGPIAGGLLSGIDRVITARMQGRQGPPLLQPFYDVAKLVRKETKIMNHLQMVCVVTYFIFVVFTGALFFGGYDMLLIFFALTTANLFLVLAATSCNSPYSTLSANREMLQMLSYEPMVLVTAIGFYLATGSFNVREIITTGTDVPFIYLPGVFVGFLFILTIKLRKHPFDLSTSHHAHQEMVKGLTIELSGQMYAVVEIAEWYETVFLLGVVAMFFLNGTVGGIIAAAVAVIVAYFVEILVDNTNARLKWNTMFRNAWAVTFIIGVINIFVLDIFKGV